MPDTHTTTGHRRTEILQTAASLIASSGLRTSLQEIADAAGILPGSLYHHFESKEAILVELLHRYHADLDRIASACAGQARRSRVTVRVRPDRGSQRGDRAMRGDAWRGAADDVLRGARSEPGTHRARPAAADGDPRGDGADVAGRPVERLPQARRRPARPRRPHRPGDAAGRSRRHPVQRQRRQAGRAAVPDPAGGTGRRAAHRCRSSTARRRSSRPTRW